MKGVQQACGSHGVVGPALPPRCPPDPQQWSRGEAPGLLPSFSTQHRRTAPGLFCLSPPHPCSYPVLEGGAKWELWRGDGKSLE